MDFAYAEGCRCCPDRLICVRRRLPVLPGSTVGARLPAKAILLQRICRLAHRVRQQAGSYRFAYFEGCRGARINEFRVRRRLPVLPGPTDFACAEGCRCCPDRPIRVRQRLPVLRGSTVGARLPAKAILPQRICRLAHRVRQQAGSYRFAYFEGCRGARINEFRVRRRLPWCPDQRVSRTPKAVGVARIN
jgi:very-short-patch-repair endonuclease